MAGGWVHVIGRPFSELDAAGVGYYRIVGGLHVVERLVRRSPMTRTALTGPFRWIEAIRYVSLNSQAQKKGGVGLAIRPPFHHELQSGHTPVAATPDYSVIALRQIEKKYCAVITSIIRRRRGLRGNGADQQGTTS